MIESVWVFPQPVSFRESTALCTRDVAVDGIACCVVDGRHYSVPVLFVAAKHTHGGRVTTCAEGIEADVHLPFWFLSSDWRRGLGVIPAINVCRMVLPGWEG